MTEAEKQEAIAYAAEILEWFEEDKGRPPIALVLDALQQEYEAAQNERRGMDPLMVRSAVQALIDVARFPPGNAPEIFDPDQPGDVMLLDAPLFRFVNRRGRPQNPETAAAVAFAVGAVCARFDMKKSRNAAPSPYRESQDTKSACDVVAAANQSLRLQPASYSGVRDCLERGYGCELISEEGRLRGAADRKSAI